MKKKQVRNLAVALGLVAALGAGGTMALLSQQSNEVTNTFAVGAGITAKDIVLDETDITKTDGTRTQEGNEYKDLQPSSSLVKDPEVHITANAADSYVFVKLEGMDAYVNELGGTQNVTIKNWLADKNWVEYKLDNDKTYDGIYYYAGPSKDGVVAKPGEGSKVSVGDVKFDSEALFTGFDLGKDAALYNADGSAKTNLPEIVIKSLAVQAAGDNAWTDAKAVVDGFDWTQK